MTRTPKHLSPETSHFPQPTTVRKGLEKGFVPGAPLKFSGSLSKTLLPKLAIQGFAAAPNPPGPRPGALPPPARGDEAVGRGPIDQPQTIKPSHYTEAPLSARTWVPPHLGARTPPPPPRLGRTEAPFPPLSSPLGFTLSVGHSLLQAGVWSRPSPPPSSRFTFSPPET